MHLILHLKIHLSIHLRSLSKTVARSYFLACYQSPLLQLGAYEVGSLLGGGHGYDDLPSGMSCFHVGDGRRNLREGQTPIDCRTDLAGLDHLRQLVEVCRGHLRLHHGDLLAATQGYAEHLRHAAEPADRSLAALGKRTSEVANR